MKRALIFLFATCLHQAVFACSMKSFSSFHEQALTKKNINIIRVLRSEVLETELKTELVAEFEQVSVVAGKKIGAGRLRLPLACPAGLPELMFVGGRAQTTL